jgi:hypothetical protein
MSHTLHADVHEAGLQDGCPRCAEHAEYPLRDLDDTMVRGLLERSFNPRNGPRSETERAAVRKVELALHQAGQIAANSPDILERYLLERWRLPTTIENDNNRKDDSDAN